MTQESDIQLSPPPREIHSLIRRRAWTEPRVRFWLWAAAVLVLFGLWFIVNGLRARSHERWLVEHGVPVEATITEADGESTKGKVQRPESSVELRFLWNDKEILPPRQELSGRKEYISVGSVIQIRVNPDNPIDWTPLDAPLPLLTHSIGGLMTLPIAAIALFCGMSRRFQLLRIWREGTAEEALIVETRFTATAPRCRAVRVTPVNEADARILTVHIPPHLANLKRGDSLSILRRSAHSSKAVAVAWFASARC